MNIKRAAGIIFVLFIAVHTSSVIGSKLLGINLETADPTIMPPAMWYIALISVSIVSVLGAMWFFRFHKTVPNTKNGFLFGLAASISGFIGDIILLAPRKDGLDILLKYYTQPWYWMAFVLILVACTLVGYTRAKKIKANS